MRYQRVRWLHSFPDEPVLIYSEVDDDDAEVRKVEIFLDGRRGYANPAEEIGGTFLGTLPMPPLAEIASDPQFAPEEISAEDFEAAWSARLSKIPLEE